MSEFLERVERTILARQLLRPGDRVVVGVSGGVDSMVLLHVLHSLAPKFNWKLTVAHLNHRLRGRSSDADERLVLRAARTLKLKCVHRAADVKSVAAQRKLSIEMAARELRHQFLAQTAKRAKASIALAHHADDQLELFFLRLLRGSDEGLAGMHWKRSSPAAADISICRPFLDVQKSELLAYAKEQGIPFREDASNSSHEFLRNRIRGELLPLLKKEYQPGLNQVIARVVEIAGRNSDFVTEAAEAWLAEKSSLARFNQLHIAVQRRCLQLQLIRLGLAADFSLIERLRIASKRISVGRHGFVRLDSNGTVYLEPSNTNDETPRGRARLSERAVTDGIRRRRARSDAPYLKDQGNQPLEIDLEELSETEFGNLRLSWKFGRSSSKRVPKRQPGTEIFDAARVGSRITLRHWKPGDRFQPIGMPAAVKLQDLFTNEKVPRPDRRQLVVACTAAGELFWVERLRISEQFKVTPQTIRRLLWHWKPR